MSTLYGSELHIPVVAGDYRGVHGGAIRGTTIMMTTFGSFMIGDLSTGTGLVYPSPMTYDSDGGTVVEGDEFYALWGSSASSFNGVIYRIAATGVCTALTGSIGYWGPLVSTSGYLAANSTVYKISDGTTKTIAGGYLAKAAGGGNIWAVSGSSLRQIDAASGSIIGTWTLAGTPEMYAKGSVYGTQICFTPSSGFTPILFDTVTHASWVAALTPPAGGAIGLWSQECGWVHGTDGHLYSIHTDRTRLNVIKPSTGQWAVLDLDPTRGQRDIVIPNPGGGLAMPSQQPNPWPGGW